MGTETNAEYFDKQESQYTESTQTRILHSYGLDTLNWESYVLKRKINLTLQKTESDSTITFQLFDVNNKYNFGKTTYIKNDKSIYISGEKHRIIEPNKYLNKEISNIAFDLYDALEPPTDWNGPFLFNIEYGILNMDVWSASLKMFVLPNDFKSDVKSDLLDKENNAEKNER